VNYPVPVYYTSLARDNNNETVHPGVVYGYTSRTPYYRDSTFPELGAAWRDPFGLIWGESVQEYNLELRMRAPISMTLEDARAYCRRISARLPTFEEVRRNRLEMAVPCDTVGNTIGFQLENGRCYAPQAMFSPVTYPGLEGHLSYPIFLNEQEMYEGRMTPLYFDAPNRGDVKLVEIPGSRLNVICVKDVPRTRSRSRR
jgi:hypothetical protein